MEIRRASPIPLDSPKAFYTNHARDAETARRAVKLALPMLTHVRRNRQTIDQKARRRPRIDTLSLPHHATARGGAGAAFRRNAA